MQLLQFWWVCISVNFSYLHLKLTLLNIKVNIKIYISHFKFFSVSELSSKLKKYCWNNCVTKLAEVDKTYKTHEILYKHIENDIEPMKSYKL